MKWIARALSDHDRPERLTLEPWLYHLALQAMNEMTARLDDWGLPFTSKTVAAHRMSKLPTKPDCNSINPTKAGRAKAPSPIAASPRPNRLRIPTK